MSVWRALLCAGAVLALLTACGNPQLGLSDGTSAVRGASTSESELLYVSDWKAAKIFVLDYPAGTFVGSIDDAGFPLGLCSDADGDVWVMNFGAGSNQVVEYAHGGTTPIATRNDTYGEPRSCSVDPVTGNLAVVNTSPASIVIYPPGSGTPTMYSPEVAYPFGCAYDGQGDLFVDGYRLQSGDHFRLSELPYGKAQFDRISVKATIGLPGDVKWDGADIAVGDYQSPGTIYRLHVMPRQHTATLAGTVTLQGPSRQPPEGAEFWLDRGTIIMPFGMGKNVKKIGFWSYPDGGSSTGSFAHFGGEELYGVAVSALPSR